MKKITVLLFACTLTQALYAQKCLDINIISLMGQLQAPTGSAACFNSCATKKNDEGQTVIVNYGPSYNQLEETMKTNAAAFNIGVMSTGTASGPNSSQVNDAKAMAAKMQGMSDDEKRAYAMQLAQQMRNAPPSAAVAEDQKIAMLVMKAQTIVTTQLTPLNNEFAAKFRELTSKEQADKAAVPQPNYSSCGAADKEGLPSCSCANGLAGGYWQKMVAVEDRYNSQKGQLLQSYLPRIKGMVTQVEDIIAQLHRGDDVKSATYKRMLYSAQSSAFSNAFSITASVIEDIEKNGSDTYVNKVNCDAQKYYLGCDHSGSK